MPDDYWDPTSGSDSTGDGSFGNPWATLNKASQEAGAAGTTGCVGSAASVLDNATWTAGSASVVFDSDVALNATDISNGKVWICPTGYSYGMYYRVDAYDSGTKTATIHTAFLMDTGSYETTLGGGVHVLGATQETYTDGQTHSFGYTADGVQGGMNVLVQDGARANLQPDNHAIFDLTDGELVLGYVSGAGAGSVCFIVTAAKSMRIKGTLYCAPGTSTSYGIRTTSSASDGQVSIDEIRVVELDNYVLYPDAGVISARTCIAQSSGTYIIYSGGSGRADIAHLRAYGNNGMRGPACGGASQVDIGHFYVRGLNTSYPPQTFDFGGKISIAYMDKDQSFTPAGTVRVGGPVAELIDIQNVFGAATKVVGRDGTGYGIRIDLGPNRYGWFTLPLVRPIPSGQSAVLKFYCVYTGTVSDVPPCFVRPIEPNGLTVEDHAVTPAYTTNTPGGSPDGWEQATQQTITFNGTTSQDGSLRIGIFGRDNLAGDAVLYIDDVTWTPAVTSGDDYGEFGFHGLEPFAFEVPAAAGGGAPNLFTGTMVR